MPTPLAVHFVKPQFPTGETVLLRARKGITQRLDTQKHRWTKVSRPNFIVTISVPHSNTMKQTSIPLRSKNGEIQYLDANTMRWTNAFPS